MLAPGKEKFSTMVGGERAWVTSTAESIRHRVGDHQFFVRATATGPPKWSLLRTASISAALPPRCVVAHKPDGAPKTVFFVLHVAHKSVLCWPVRQAAARAWTLASHDEAKPVWTSFHELTRLVVLPSWTVCPEVASTLKGIFDCDHGIVHEHTAPKELLKYQAENGFGGATEAALLQIHEVEGLNKPADDLLSLGVEEALTANLCRHLIPGLTEECCQDILVARASFEETSKWLMDDDVDMDIFDDVADKKDRAEARKNQEKLKAVRNRRAASTRASGFVVERMFSGGKVAKKSAKGLAVLKKAAAANEGGNGAKWWASIQGDPTLLLEHKPAEATVSVDPIAGRYFISYPGQLKKSIAWTERSNAGAIKLALGTLWGWWSKRHQKPVPVGVQHIIDAL